MKSHRDIGIVVHLNRLAPHDEFVAHGDDVGEVVGVEPGGMTVDVRWRKSERVRTYDSRHVSRHRDVLYDVTHGDKGLVVDDYSDVLRLEVFDEGHCGAFEFSNDRAGVVLVEGLISSLQDWLSRRTGGGV
jgi:hypothetical protein